jgi:hypothetical protein
MNSIPRLSSCRIRGYQGDDDGMSSPDPRAPDIPSRGWMGWFAGRLGQRDVSHVSALPSGGAGRDSSAGIGCANYRSGIIDDHDVAKVLQYVRDSAQAIP